MPSRWDMLILASYFLVPMAIGMAIVTLLPIIQAMLSLGMGVGPAGALLMTLPPISVPSLAMLVRSFRPRVLLIVTGAVAAFGLAGGLLAVGLGF